MRVPVQAVVLAAAVSATVSVAATLWLVGVPRYERAAKKPRSEAYSPRVYAQEIVDEQQARTRAFLKPEGMDKLRRATVAVVGVGGVGSWAALMLVRSGIGRIIIIDFDQVSLSSLNRHACATLADVGTSKVDCLANFCRSVAPWVEVVPINSLWNADIGPAFLEGADYVVDCIDNLETKVDLLAHCKSNEIEVISSMGAGTKADPTRIMVGDISQTYEDPLSRTVRIMLRAKNITTGIATVYSTEKPGKEKAKLLQVEDDLVKEGDVSELSVLKDFRVRILPVLGPLPAMFGLTIASHLLCKISGYNSVFDPVQGGYSMAGKNRHKLYDSMLRSANAQCTRLKLNTKVTCTNLDEVEYLIEEVWRGKTLNGDFSRHKLTLWDPSLPADIHNMVPVTREEQDRHEKLVFIEKRPLSEVYTEKQLREVQQRFELDRWYMQFRVN